MFGRDDRFAHTALEGGFRTGALIGVGAFAAVYEGWSAGDEKVAVKIATRRDAQAERRFYREIKVTAELPPNPHCVGYRGAGKLADGTPWLALEFVDGFTLRQALDKHRCLPERAACVFMHQLCIGFAGLHRLGLVHRDIKPDNIMITRRTQHVKLLDFGMVHDSQGLLKLFEEQDLVDGQHFAEDLDRGMVAGTLEYMAPEQISDSAARRAAQRTDTTADVYSIGVIFFHLLTGEKPFPFVRRSPREEPHPQEILDYLQGRVQQRDEDLHQPAAIGDELWSILCKALRRDPKRRQGSARELAADIERYLRSGEGVDDDSISETFVEGMDELSGLRGIDTDEELKSVSQLDPLAPMTSGRKLEAAQIGRPPPALETGDESPGGAPAAATPPKRQTGPSSSSPRLHGGDPLLTTHRIDQRKRPPAAALLLVGVLLAIAAVLALLLLFSGGCAAELPSRRTASAEPSPRPDAPATTVRYSCAGFVPRERGGHRHVSGDCCSRGPAARPRVRPCTNADAQLAGLRRAAREVVAALGRHRRPGSSRPPAWQKADEAIARAARIDPSHLRLPARVIEQNALLIIASLALSTKKTSIARRAAAQVRRFALPAHDLQAMLGSPREVLRPFLGDPARWRDKRTPAAGLPADTPLHHETCHGYAIAFRPVEAAGVRAIFGRLIAIDERWRPHVTAIVDSLEMRRGPGVDAAACIATLDERSAGCEHSFGLAVVERAAELPAHPFVTREGNRVTCAGCHPRAGAGGFNLPFIAASERSALLAHRHRTLIAALAGRLAGLRRLLEPAP